MKRQAAWAIAGMVPEKELSAECIIPSPLNREVADVVAKAVAETARKEGEKQELKINRMILLAWKKMRGAVAQWISDYLWGQQLPFYYQ